jgi:small ligand-binding sensory domain FIST
MSPGGIRIGAGVCVEPDPLAAGLRAAGGAASGLSGKPADVAVVFASGDHLAAPEALLEGVHSALTPGVLIGCGAGGVLGEGHEHESGTAVAVWAATLGAGSATAFRAIASGPEVGAEIEGLPDLDGAAATILLADPYSFSSDAALAELAGSAPAVPVLGGVSSARTPAGSSALFLGEEVLADGAVGIGLAGVDMLPCVSQGAAPLGREVTITRGEGNVIYQLAGQPALETIARIISELTPRERALVARGILIGIVIDTGKPEYQQGDFLVRGVLGADRDTGAMAVGTTVHTGQIVRLHVRDARSADADLRRALQLRVEAMAGRAPAGALLFSCNGRGRAMFSVGDHDAATVQRELGGAPSAGFFAAGEIGPIGGRSFLHGFTATVAVFPESQP